MSRTLASGRAWNGVVVIENPDPPASRSKLKEIALGAIWLCIMVLGYALSLKLIAIVAAQFGR